MKFRLQSDRAHKLATDELDAKDDVEHRLLIGNERVREAVNEFFARAKRKEIEPSRDQLEVALPKISDIARSYYQDHDTDSRMRLSLMKAQARKIELHLRKANQLLEEAPEEMTLLIDSIIRSKSQNLSTQLSLHEEVKSIIRVSHACFHIQEQRFKRESKKSLFNACVSLWDLREELTGEQFLRSWDDGDVSDITREAGNLRRFTSSDGRFVQVILHAIDPEVNMSRVRTQLKKIAQLKPRSGPREKSRKVPT